MEHIVKIFSLCGEGLGAAVNSYMKDWKKNNLGHLNIFGVTALDIQKIGGIDTQIWVTFNVMPLDGVELALLEGSR